MPKLPAGLVSGLNWNENNADLAFSITSACSPLDVYSSFGRSGDASVELYGVQRIHSVLVWNS
ncbi:MAG: hypothetical protein WBV55_05655 [Candidatus Sulfotelmatobacter sp.]